LAADGFNLRSVADRVGEEGFFRRVLVSAEKKDDHVRIRGGSLDLFHAAKALLAGGEIGVADVFVGKGKTLFRAELYLLTDYGGELFERALAQDWTDERDVCLFYEAVIDADVDPNRAATLLLNNLAKRANERGCLVHELGVTPRQLAAIEQLRMENKISSNGADELIAHCIDAGVGADAATLAEEKGLLQVSDDSALEAWIDKAIESEPQAADDVRGGKMAAIGRLVGAVMKASRGKANPKMVQQKLREKLSG